MPTPYERRRYLRPIRPEGDELPAFGELPVYDVYIGSFLPTPWAESPGYWSDTRRGRIQQTSANTWTAFYMVGQNPELYPIAGTYPTRKLAALRVDEYSQDQGRIHRQQAEYERAHGWTND